MIEDNKGPHDVIRLRDNGFKFSSILVCMCASREKVTCVYLRRA